MLTELLARAPGRQGPRKPPHPDQPLYVIGDIHGRADLLERLLARIDGEAPTAARIVCVGDYIDRGPDSARVLALLRGRGHGPGPVPVCLAGNHEAMLLRFLDGAETGLRWLANGGRATVRSFGLPDPGAAPPASALAGLRAALRRAIPPTDLAFLRALPLLHVSGNVMISHAGGDPGRSPAGQRPDDLLWGPPSGGPRSDGLWSVSGHRVVACAHARDGRIRLDTGAWLTGRLTAAVLDGGPVRFLVA